MIKLCGFEQFRCLRLAVSFGSLRFDVISACLAGIEMRDEYRVVKRYMTEVKKSVVSLVITDTTFCVHDSTCAKYFM